MNDLFYKKYGYDHNDADYICGCFPKEPEYKYGFIAIKNPNYLKKKTEGVLKDSYCDEREYIYRKPTKLERKEIVVNTIIEHNGKSFSIPKLAKLLAVSDRIIQTLLRELENEKIIEIIPRYSKTGARKSNVYKYIGEPCKFYGTGLNLHILYNPKVEVGFRHWTWFGQYFFHNKKWHDMYTLCKMKFDSRVSRGEYLKKNNLPLKVPEKIKYLVLRYSYWKGKRDREPSDYQYSRDGTIKIALDTIEKTKIIKFIEYTLELRFIGNKDNPIIEIYNNDDKEHLATFTYFNENIIERAIDLDDKTAEQFFILGDFTIK